MSLLEEKEFLAARLRAQTTAHHEHKVHVIPVDGSHYADHAFEWATKNTAPDDEFVVMHGFYTSGPPIIPFIPIPPPGKPNLPPERVEDDSHIRILRKYEQMCRETNRRCTFVGVPFRTISNLSHHVVHVAQTHGAESIIMGSRGLGMPTRALFGSVSSAVMNESPIPVTIVKDLNAPKQSTLQTIFRPESV